MGRRSEGWRGAGAVDGETVSDEMMVKESGKSASSMRRFGARVKPELLIGRNGAAKDEEGEETLGWGAD